MLSGARPTRVKSSKPFSSFSTFSSAAGSGAFRVSSSLSGSVVYVTPSSFWSLR